MVGIHDLLESQFLRRAFVTSDRIEGVRACSIDSHLSDCAGQVQNIDHHIAILELLACLDFAYHRMKNDIRNLIADAKNHKLRAPVRFRKSDRVGESRRNGISADTNEGKTVAFYQAVNLPEKFIPCECHSNYLPCVGTAVILAHLPSNDPDNDKT